MSHSVLAAALGAVALLAASPVAAEPFQNFLRMCMVADAEARAAGDAADAAGWTKFPASDLGEGGDLPFEDAEVYVFLSSADEEKAIAEMEILLTGWQSGEEMLKAEEVRLDLCAVGGPGAIGDAIEAMEDHIGFPPVDINGSTVWMFSRQGERFRSENDYFDDESEARIEAVLTRKLRMAGVMRQGDMTLFLLGAARPRP